MAVRTTETVPWPRVEPAEPWWWSDCSPFLKRWHVRVACVEAGSKSDALRARVAAGEDVPWATVVEEVFEPWKAAYDATPEGIAARQRRGEVRRWLSAQEEEQRACYVRFGAPPPGGRSSSSRNYHDGTDEGGLCVFRAQETPEGEYWIDPGEEADLVLTLLVLFFERRSRGYLAAGKEVGIGSAGEPLLVDFSLRPIPPGEIKSVWEPPPWWRAGLFIRRLNNFLSLEGGALRPA